MSMSSSPAAALPHYEAEIRLFRFAPDRRTAAELRAIPLRLAHKRVVAVAGERRWRCAQVFAALEENVSPVAANRGEHSRGDEVAVRAGWR